MLAWRLLGDVVVAAHFGFLLYLIVGGFVAWRWPWTIVTHLATAIWAVLIVTTKVPCPLTWLQNVARRHGGQTRLRAGFIQSYVQGHIYPADHERLVQVAVGFVVLISWLGYVVRMRRRAGARQVTRGAATGGPNPVSSRSPN